MRTITIDRRFHGPPDSGNGGYSCGLVAGQLDGPMEVSLRAPPPLERPLAIGEPDDDGVVQVRDGDALVAIATPTSPVDLTPPRIVSLLEAIDAKDRYRHYEQHAFPTCWVCGPRRPAGEGLHIYPGTVAGDDRVSAAPWVPAPDLDTGDGTVAAEHVWAALDCPSYFGGWDGRLAVLGQLAIQQHEPVAVGEPYIVMGWATGPANGRKLPAASTILGEDGAVVAVGRALWIDIGRESTTRTFGGEV